MVGVSHVNMNEWILNVIEFADNESLTNFESVLVQLSPKEAVICATASQSEEQATLTKVSFFLYHVLYLLLNLYVVCSYQICCKN